MTETLTIDSCSICQLHCAKCPATQMGYPFTIGSGFLKFADFKNLIDKNPGFKRVELDNIGEMFLNPDLLKIIEYAHNKNIPIGCSTGANMNNVKDEVLEGLVKYNFQYLTCSIDGASQGTYSQYRIGGDYDTVLTNVKKLNSYKQKYKSKFPILTWQFIVFGHNEHELPIAKEKAEKMNMRFYPKTSWDPRYSPIKNRDFVLSETGWPVLTREEHEKLTGNSFLRSTCHSLWHSPRINWDGRVLGCCWNTWSDFGGNVFVDGYNEAVNNNTMNSAKLTLMNTKFTENIPCIKCEHYQKMKTTGRYLTLNEIFPKAPLWYKGVRFIYRVSGLNKFKLKETVGKFMKIFPTGK